MYVLQLSQLLLELYSSVVGSMKSGTSRTERWAEEDE